MIIAMRKTLGDVVIMEGSESSNGNVLPIKQEPAFLEQENETNDHEYEEEFYGNNFQGYGKYRKNAYNHRGRARGSFYSGRGNFNKNKDFQGSQDGNQQKSHQQNSRGGRGNHQLNPKDRATGKPRVCNTCKSIYHFVKDCPVMKEKDSDTSYFLDSIKGEDCETIDTAYETIMLLDGVSRRALVDSGCVTSVCGSTWLDDFKKGSLTNSLKIKEEYPLATKKFRFGDGPTQASSKIVKLPISLCGKERMLEAFVIEGDIPLLLSKTAMSEFEAILDFKNDTISMGGIEQTMHVAKTGHYVVDIDHPVEEIDLVMLCKEEKDPKKAALKLHRYFGHPSSKRLTDLIKNSDADQRMVKYINELDCDTCARFKRERPKPKASLMTSSEFNGVVALDLKELSTGDLMIHMIDMFTRFSGTSIIKNKHQNTIIDAMFSIWISIFGRPKLVFNDNGGEFTNDSFISVCESLGIVVKATAANSPFSNGVCERRNGLIGETFDKIMEDVKCSPAIALAWATNANNSYNNSYGFSSYQLVLGKTPSIPGLDNIQLASELNDTTVSKMIADHLNAMYLSRQAYIKATQSALLKRALSDRVTFQDEKYFLGDQVYFKRKNLKRWCGPAVVIGQDGKIVIVRQGGFTLRVHASRVALRSRAEKEILGEVCQPTEDPNKQVSVLEKQNTPQENVQNVDDQSDTDDDDLHLNTANEQQTLGDNDGAHLPGELNPSENLEEESTEEREHHRDLASESLEGTVLRDNQSKANQDSGKWESIEFKKNGVLDIRSGDTIRWKDPSDDESEWEEAKVSGPAGKVTGKYKNLFNVVKSKDESEHNVQLDKVQVEKSTEKVLYIEEERSYVVNVPKDRYHELPIQKAMDEEMERWKSYETYREVYDRGQKTISTRWVVTEKQNGYKARLVVRGFEEVDEAGLSDSPTADKATLRLILSIAASENWKLQSIDVKSAYLQAETLERDVFVKPPKKFKKPGLIWQLDKPAYGLIDSARNWYDSISNFLISLGCKKCIYDKALFYYCIDNKLIGLMLMHVDDFLFCGTAKFHTDVIKPLKKKYETSRHEHGAFKYIGIDISQDDLGITLDQTKYIQCVQKVQVKAARQEEAEEKLTKEEQTEYLSLLGKISWLAQMTRPDLKYDVYHYSRHNKNTTVQNQLDLNGIVSKVYNQHQSMRFPKLNIKKPWKLVVYADASFGNLDNKVNSARGYIVLLCDGEHACILTWNSNKVSRVVTSVLESETIALKDGIRHAELLRTILCTVKYNTHECDKAILPIIAFTDSSQLWKSIHSTKRCKDVALHRDICLLQEKLQESIISEIRWISNELQIADCLTKNGAHPKKLAIVVETGKLNV